MTRVSRKLVPAIKIGNYTYRTPHTAARAFADEVALQMDDRYIARMDQIYHEDDPFWDTVEGVYDISYEKAYRRSLPIFRKFFEQGEEKY